MHEIKEMQAQIDAMNARLGAAEARQKRTEKRISKIVIALRLFVDKENTTLRNIGKTQKEV